MAVDHNHHYLPDLNHLEKLTSYTISDSHIQNTTDNKINTCVGICLRPEKHIVLPFFNVYEHGEIPISISFFSKQRLNFSYLHMPSISKKMMVIYPGPNLWK